MDVEIPTQGEELEQGTQGTEESAPEQSNGTQELTDLSTLDKFMFDGKEMTFEELKKSHMLHSDYTKKSQEMAEIRGHWDKLPEYRKNLNADLEAVKANPALAEEFKKIYPEAFHGDLEKILQDHGEARQEGGSLPYEVQQKLQRLEQFANSYEQEKYEQQVQAEEMKLEKMEQEMAKKYPHADASVVYAQVQALMDKDGLKSEDVNDKVWENAWKSVNNQLESRFKNYQNTNFNKQTQANLEGRDVGQGGSIPGEAPKKLKLSEVADHMIADLRNRQG